MNVRSSINQGKVIHISVCIILVASIFILFARTWDYDFLNYDDDDYVTENEFVRDGLTLKGLQWAFTTTLHDHWHPLTWISHMIDCQIFELDPSGHHIVNVLFHALTALVIFLTFLRMTGRYYPSLAVAIFFAIHPMNVQSVAWIAERKNLLSTFLAFSSLFCYVTYVLHKKKVYYIAAFVLFLLGLLAKSMLVTLPVLMLILDFWPLQREGAIPSSSRGTAASIRQWARFIIEKLPFFAASGAIAIATLMIREHRLEGVNAIPKHMLDRLGEAMTSYATYLAKFFWPADLAIIYPPTTSPESWVVTLSILVITTVSIAAVMCITKAPYFAMGWAWYLLSITPVIGIFQTGPQLMADRYVYIPYIGLFAAIFWFLSDFSMRNIQYKNYILTIIALIIISMSYATWDYTEKWKNSIAIFEHTTQTSKRNAKAHVNLGLALLQSGKTNDAIRQFKIATIINPNDYLAQFNLGNFYFKNQDYNTSEIHFKKSIAGNPKFEKAYTNLGIALMHMKKFDEAEQAFMSAINLNIYSSKATYNLGLLYEITKRKEKAINYYKKTLEISPGHEKSIERLSLIK